MEGNKQKSKPSSGEPHSASTKDETQLFQELFAKLNSNIRFGGKFKARVMKELEALRARNVGWSQTAAKYFPKEGVTIDLSFKDIWSVSNDNAFLDEPVLDALLYHNLKNENVGYIDTRLLESIESEESSEATPTPFKNDKDAYVAVKKINKVHWSLVFLSFKNKTAYVVDPMREGIVEGSDEILEAFKRVHHNELNEEEAKGSKWDFENQGWKVGCIDHELQEGAWNCGLRCVVLAKMLTTVNSSDDSSWMLEKFEVDEEVDDLRRYYTIQILGISKFVQPEKVSN